MAGYQKVVVAHWEFLVMFVLEALKRRAACARLAR